MSDFWSKAKEEAEKLAKRANDEAHVTKFKGDKMICERTIRQNKENFGKEVYEYMASGNEELVKQIFLKYKTLIDEQNALIAQKDAQISAIRATYNPSGSAATGAPVQSSPGGMTL